MQGRMFGARARGVAGAVYMAAALGIVGVPAVFAQTVAQVGGPAEMPPAGFGGQQYVDSRGCVFMRAGFAGQTSWVPRIGADRKPLCGQVTGAQAAARLQEAGRLQEVGRLQEAEADLGGNGAAGAAPVAAPMATVASNMKQTAGTGVIAPMPVPGLMANGRAVGGQAAVQMPSVQMLNQTAARGLAQLDGAATAAARRQAAGCPAKAPVLEYLPLRGGGSVAVCTRGDGSATGWMSPSYVASAAPGAALRGQAAVGHSQVGQVEEGQVAQARAVAPAAKAPAAIAGAEAAAPAATAYVAAWTDDRLNPLRGLGTARGWADQAKVWDNTVPAQPARRSASSASAQNDAAIGGSSRSYAAPAQGAAQMRAYVQVGTFAQAGNAQNAAARLGGLGLPVASAKGNLNGQALVAILAGPFASTAAAQEALRLARGAGFGDAFVR